MGWVGSEICMPIKLLANAEALSTDNLNYSAPTGANNSWIIKKGFIYLQVIKYCFLSETEVSKANSNLVIENKWGK